MTVGAPFALLALLAVPAIVVLHLFRNRLPVRRVAALFLFPPQALIAGAGRNRSRLLRTPSFWCELAAALLLAAWLADLSFGGAATRPLVVVLDDSASMASRSTHEHALRLARERLAAAGGVLGIVRSGARPEILLDPRERVRDVAAALQRWRPAQPRHDLGLSLDVARELAGDGGEVVFVTDEDPPVGHDDVTVLACGVPAPNCALLGAERRVAPGGELVRVRVAAYGSVAATAVTVSAGTQQLAHTALAFTAGHTEVDLPVPAGHDELRVQLTPDALAVDDAMWLLPAPVRTVAIADTLPAERSAALGIGRVLAALPDCRSVPSRGEAQLVLAAAPGHVGQGQTEVVIDAGDGEVRGHRAPFVIDRASPWIDGLQLAGVTWAAGTADLPGRVLIAAGPHVLASDEPLDAGRRLWLRLEGARGNLVRSPDWPVLFANLVESARGDVPGLVTAQVAVGSEVVYQRRRGDGQLAVVAPGGERKALEGGPRLGCVPEQPGVHRLLGPGEAELARFAAHFVDASESDLRGVRTASRPGQPASTARRAPLRDTGQERLWLAALVLLLLSADWWLLRRRET